MKTRISPVLITFALACFALLPKAHGVVPPPDGGYPGFNTAEGQNALFSLTTGAGNTAVGWFSLFSDTTASFNTGVGAGTLLFNNGDQNTAVGAVALLSNTTGFLNTAIGASALFSNTAGFQNTAVGTAALLNNTSNFNTATGDSALLSNITGQLNTANGASALVDNTSGGGNTAIGQSALLNNTTGFSNTALGSGAGQGVFDASNVICIGAVGANVDNSCYIGSIAGQTVGAGGTTCYVDNNGKLGVFLSAHRFKTDIADMGNASEALLALRPVTFHYNPELDKTCIPQFGLVAEEVAKVNPDLVTHDAKGELYTVRYEAINVMLLNEFLKEHKKVEKLESVVASLAATVKEQAAQIQKVSAQLEASKSAPRVVNNR
jgi:hypothetical protein